MPNSKSSSKFHSLYFHFPFCETKCHYCDFYSLGREKTKTGDATTFERVMLEEIRLRGEAGDLTAPLDTIFLGGGTPSITPPDSMERIFAELFRYTKLNGTVTNGRWRLILHRLKLEQFKRYPRAWNQPRQHGRTKLKERSILQTWGRVHNEGEALRALDSVFSAGFR